MYNIAKNFVILTTIFGSTISQNTATNEENRPIERLHVRKCHEYQSAVYDYISVLSLVAGGERQRIPIDKCGHKKIGLIVGGTLAEPKEFPHMALIGFVTGNNTTNWACGGTLISYNYILTAAHCAYSRALGEPQFALLGDLDIQAITDDAKPKEYQIEKIITHPHYRISVKYNDIALLKLTENIQLNPYIRPACLPTEFDSSDGKHYIATGWGNTKWSGESSPHLQKVILDKYNNTECNKMYFKLLTKSLKDGIKNDTQICAGSLSGNKDTCQGDSGGPLQIYHNSEYCMYTIIGITSFGDTCAQAVPGVYTRIYPYIDWIEDIVWPTN